MAAQRDRENQALSRSQLRARNRPRNRGQFVADPTAPGTSVSSVRRISQRAIADSRVQRRKNVQDILDALLCPGSDKDYIGGSASDGPLVSIVQRILKPECSIATCYIIGVAKGLYLKRYRKKSLPRKNVRNNGRIVKYRAYVFSGVRPDPSRQDTLAEIKAVISRHKSKGRILHEDTDTTMRSITPLLNCYDATSFEYIGYPLVTNAGEAEETRIESQPQLVVEDQNAINRQEYIPRMNKTALCDSDYMVLKKALADDGPLACKETVREWKRVLVSLSQNGQLTAMENALIEYGLEEDAQRRGQLEEGFKQMLEFMMHVRRADGKDLMLEIGYNPLEYMYVGGNSDNRNQD